MAYGLKSVVKTLERSYDKLISIIMLLMFTYSLIYC